MTIHHPFGRKVPVGVPEHHDLVATAPTSSPAAKPYRPLHQYRAEHPPAAGHPQAAEQPYGMVQPPAAGPAEQQIAVLQQIIGQTQAADPPPAEQPPAVGYPSPAGQPDTAGQPYPMASQQVDLPPPVYGAVTPYEQPLPEHGGYLVRYPERLDGARTAGPAVWPVALFTMVFGLFAVISVRRRAARARAAGGSPKPYWQAFWVTCGVGAAISAVVIAGIAVPAYLAARESAVVTALQQNLVTDGRLVKTAKLTATRARCTAEGERGDDGIRPYTCALTLANGRSGQLRVTADSDGVWALAPGR